MTRKTKIIIGVAAVLLAGGGATVALTRGGKDVIPVTFGKVERTDLTSKVTSNGRLDAKTKVDLSANVMGRSSTSPCARATS